MISTPVFKWGAISPRQNLVLTWWLNDEYKDCDGIIADGAIRSGKTVSMGFSFVLWAMDSFNDQQFGMCGKTIGSFRRNVLATLKKQLSARGYTVEDKRADNLLVISKGETTNYFYLFGGKDERSQDLIQGITLAGIFFDEVALMPRSFVEQGTARCSVEGSKFWFNCNPSSPQHWFYLEWIKRVTERNLVYLHFTMDDNLSLSEHIKARYAAQYTGVFYDRYIRGLWVIAEGIIYRCFNNADHVFRKTPATEGDTIVSCDFGIRNANVFLLWRKESGSKRWLCLDEERWSGREEENDKTVKELVDGLDDMLARNNAPKPKYVIVDPSASALKVELRRRGYKVRDGNNDVLDGIEAVMSALLERLIAFSDKCKGTIKEFGLYAWDEKASNRGEDKPIKENDHGCDAVRYFVRTMNITKKEKERSTNIYLA